MSSSLTNQFHERLSRRGRLNAALAAGTILISSASQLQAQMAPLTPPPQITVSARGEVQVAPDRARVQVGVETRQEIYPRIKLADKGTVVEGRGQEEPAALGGAEDAVGHAQEFTHGGDVM